MPKKEITIEPAKYGSGFSVYEWGTYERGSVLAGQTKKQFRRGFDTLAEAREAFPDAEVSEGVRSAENTFGHLPGSDHLDDQGGVWGEDLTDGVDILTDGEL
tara:strand:+ start:1074 stop:1379 length:306 start_codon:yes stop_codon:yes gene_type:complete